ncbi:MAG: zinc ribbon domain-containing protein, partial [Terriglobia bacterium]
RLLSAPAIQFKGSGWYVTDYARKSAPAEKSGSPAEGETRSGKGDAKKAEKKESPASGSKKSD